MLRKSAQVPTPLCSGYCRKFIARRVGCHASLFRHCLKLAATERLCHNDHLKRGMAESLRDLLEIVEDRYGAGSLIITSQHSADLWYEFVGNPSLADAILGRIV